MSQKYNQYFSTRPRLSIAMKSGTIIRFVGGQYVTDVPDEISFLDEQIAAGHSMLYVKKGSETVTQEQLDPMAAIKKKAVEEYLAQQQKQQDASRDMGKTENTGAGIDVTTSKSISAIVVGSKSK